MAALNTYLSLFKGTHALIEFTEGEDKYSTAVIPTTRLEKCVDDSWEVLWSDKQRYKVSYIMSGTRGECKKRQKEVEAEESSSDNDVVNEKQVVDEKENVNPNTTRKRKRKPVIVNKQSGDDKKKKSNKTKADKKSDGFEIQVGIAPKRNGPPKTPDSKPEDDLIHNLDSKVSGCSSDTTSLEVMTDGSLNKITSSDSNEGVHNSSSDSSKEIHNSSSDSGEEVNNLSSDSSEVHNLSSDSSEVHNLSSDGSGVYNPKKIIVISHDNERSNRLASPKHYTDGIKDPDDIIKRVVTLEKESYARNVDMDWKYDDLRKKVLDLHGTVTDIKKVLGVLVTGTSHVKTIPMTLTSVATSAIPSSLIMSTSPTSTPCVVSTSYVASTSLITSTPCVASTAILNSALPMASTSTASTPTTPTSTDLEPASEIEVSHSNIIPDSEVMQIVLKSCSRMNFAARLSVRLFDEETRLTHNVAGRGKPKLDPKIISFIKCKCFEMFPCSVSESVASEWASCVTAIDERSRRLKNKPLKKKN